ncbi:MAG: sigma-70 family RNA polymerase sigma factor [Planctomycetes bacterium]|nr:sigma-70 family RNA polymerase sigma factor [Planctomycetota bacterium]
MTTAASHPDTKHLISRVRRDDASAWGHLYTRYDERLGRLARRLIGQKLVGVYDPEDLVAETWHRVLPLVKNFQYDKRGGFYGLLRLYATRIVAEWGRKGGKGRKAIEDQGRLAMDDLAAQLPQGGRGIITQAHHADLHARIMTGLNDPRMPRVYREVLHAELIEERSREDIASERGLRQDTLKKQIHRGKEKLAEILGDLEF